MCGWKNSATRRKKSGDEEIRVRDLVFSGKTLIASSCDQSLELTRREMDLLLYLTDITTGLSRKRNC
jgi:DNA-binding response OmpR family regulator